MSTDSDDFLCEELGCQQAIAYYGPRCNGCRKRLCWSHIRQHKAKHRGESRHNAAAWRKEQADKKRLAAWQANTTQEAGR